MAVRSTHDLIVDLDVTPGGVPRRPGDHGQELPDD
jgi:hypothetical protein